MLYITTRDNRDAFTAHRALTEDYAPDGGRYIPFRLPQLSESDLLALKDKPFGQIIADIMNTFFSSHLTGWDVDCCIGRNMSRIKSIHHKIAIAELWHNPQASYAYIVNSLYNTIINQNSSRSGPTEWFCIAARIAVLFGLYGEMQKQQIISDTETFDISVPAGDLSAPIAAYYAKNMGLPIQKIICSDLDNSSVWDLIQRGTFNSLINDETLYSGIERLIQAVLGFDAVQLFREKCQRKQVFSVDEIQNRSLSDIFFCSVVGATRLDSIINSVYRSNNYIIDPHTALCHGGLQDYRAKTGNSRATLLLAGKSPLSAREQICAAIGIDSEKLIEHVNLS